MKTKTHDYTRRGWGHDFTFEPEQGGKQGSMMGWGHGLNNGDYLILPVRGGTTRYQIETVEYFMNPSDMWKASVVFAPRSGKGG